ncbi:MAG TPA: PQQ-dependent sugar dehydrogenase [Chitinophagaceae bacterium]|nr:PQQ-dependent sugar dehydrogenase [Chitinophagaceae bacterium]
MKKLLSCLTILFISNYLFSQAPANDNCAGAATLTAGTPLAGTVWAATATGSIPVGCAIGNPDDDVWYKFTTPVSAGTAATLSLSLIGTDLNTTGAIIQLFSGTCAGLTSVACANGAISPLAINSLANNTTYYVRVYSYTAGALSSSGASAFTIKYTSSIAPTNDECSNAILIPSSTVTINSYGWLQGATTSADVPVCAGTFKYDAWYKFVATKANPTIALSSPGANISGNVRLQLLSGSCGSMSSLACSAGTSIVASGLTIGTIYYIRVYSNTASATTFTSAANFNIAVTDPGTAPVVDSTTILFNMDTVAKNLGYPWEITYGPDDSLWITEARGYRVLRISSNRTQANLNVAPQQVLKLPLNSNGNPGPTFGRTIGTWPQGGLEGLAIHPDFKTDPTKQWVYIAYVYSGTCPGSPAAPCIFRSKIIRCQFYYAADAGNPTSLPHRDTLVIMDTVISNLPGSNDHNSGRLTIKPVKDGPGTPTYKLFYTIGDMGAGQFNNTTRTNYAQTLDTCEGKILRLNTEPDLDPSFGVTHDYNTWREWIPNDNPFTHSLFPTLRTPIFSYGHRNAQGVAWGNPNGTWNLYESEHGDRSSDEVNIISSGNNYGWPKVTGIADNNYSTTDNLTNGFTQNDILANVSVSDETTFSNNTTNFTNPIFDFFNWNPARIETENSGNIFTWSTIAPSSIDFYSGNIPGWKNSLLVTSLKYGLYRLHLNASGTSIDSTATTNVSDTMPLLHGWRIRDIAINPVANSGQFWAVTDSSGSTSGPTGGFGGGSQATANGGRVLRLTFKTLITLPVEFISFNGQLLTDRTIQLNWETSTSQDHAYFDVEKSLTNSSFTPIGRVTGTPPYSLIDVSPNIGANYYRIKEVTTSGKTVYSRIIKIVYNNSQLILTIYPNPVREIVNLKVSSLKNDNINIQVADMQGRVIYKSTKLVSAGMNEIPLDARKWSPQLYSVKITGSDNKTLAVDKFVKQ